MKLYILLILSLVLQYGCVSQGNFRMANMDSSSSAVVSSDGITLFVKPILDSDKLESYYGTNLVKKGILPIQVRILNESKYDVGVSVDNFSLIDRQGESHKVINLDNIYEKVKNSHAFVVLDIPLILITGAPLAHVALSGSNIGTDTNLKVTIFKDGVIPRQKSMEGIIYVHLAKELQSVNNWVFSSKIFLRDSDKNMVLTTPL
jgi:hypothetical protein